MVGLVELVGNPQAEGCPVVFILETGHTVPNLTQPNHAVSHRTKPNHILPNYTPRRWRLLELVGTECLGRDIDNVRSR